MFCCQLFNIRQILKLQNDIKSHLFIYLFSSLNDKALDAMYGYMPVVCNNVPSTLLHLFRSYHAADTWAAICIAVMMVGTMFPMSVYTGKILLQVKLQDS